MEKHIESKAEVITCGGCGALFAACVDGHQDDEWNKSKESYVKRGDIATFIPSSQVQFKKCTCPEKEVSKLKDRIYELENKVSDLENTISRLKQDKKIMEQEAEVSNFNSMQKAVLYRQALLLIEKLPNELGILIESNFTISGGSCMKK